METKEMIDILLKYADSGVKFEKYKIAKRIALRLEHLQTELDAALAEKPPCKVGDLVRFKGLESPWKVSAIHLYAEGQPQISVTSGKITTTMTFSEFSEDAFVLSQEEAEKALKESDDK